MTSESPPIALRLPGVRRDPLSPGALLVLALAAVIGIVVCLFARSDLAAWIVAAGVVQLVATGSGLLLWARPLLWSVAVGTTMILTVSADAELAQLVSAGAMPWTTISVALAAATLVRRSTSWPELAGGTLALGAGTWAVVRTAIDDGSPFAGAFLTASVPFLAGALIATRHQLRQARLDREQALAEADHPATPQPDRAARALATIALRADALSTAARPDRVRAVAEDIRELAREALIGEHEGQSIVRIELVDAADVEPATSGTPTDSAAPDLSDREQAVLRLLATGATNRAIADDLYLSEASIKQQVSRLMKRFQADNRTQLALQAHRWFPDQPIRSPPTRTK